MNDLERVREWAVALGGSNIVALVDTHKAQDAARDEQHRNAEMGLAMKLAAAEAELVPLREAANAEMKASLGYQAELAALREAVRELMDSVQKYGGTAEAAMMEGNWSHLRQLIEEKL